MKKAYQPSAEEIQALVDGELSPEAAARVRSALPSSESAIAELDECLQVAALARELRDETARAGAAPDSTQTSGPPAGASPAPIIPLLPRPGRNRLRASARFIRLSAAVGAAAAMVVVGIVVERTINGGRAQDPSAEEIFASALAPKRGIAARLSWPGADRHRPYDTARASGRESGNEVLSFELLGRIEKLGDPRAPAAAHLLLGNSRQAAQALAALEASASTRSDRAAIALVEDKPEEALLAAADALAGDPRHVQAAWNRALALERLGLALSAADAFASVSARGEPGWSQEAAERAAALRSQIERRQAEWTAANQAGARLLAGGDVEQAVVASHPGLVREFFYDAVGAAGSAARVHALRPLAEALDARFGGGHLVALVDRVARADFARRGPLAARYALLARRDLVPERREAQALIRALRAAGQEDMLLGALFHGAATRRQVDAQHLDEYVRLARATRDPWFELLAEEQRARAAIAGEDLSVAHTVLDAAAARCDAGGIDVRCQRIFYLLTYTCVALHRPDAARRALDRARRTARATGTVDLEIRTLDYAQAVAGLRDDTSGSLLALSQAYLDESSRHESSCKARRQAREVMAEALINRDRLAEARREMEHEDQACEAPITAHRAFVLAHLLRRGGDEASVVQLRRDIAELRVASDTSPGERVFLDHVEGRLLVDRSPPEGRTLLRRAIDTARAVPRDDIDAVKARSYSYSVLAEDAAARGDHRAALELLAEERGLTAPARCALGASLEDSSVFAARGADGRTVGARVASTPGEPGPRPLPAAVRAALAGCEVVEVFARQPYYGRPDLLPFDMAWEFRTGARPVQPAAGADKRVIVANIDPPAGLDLAPLQRIAAAPGTTLIEGPAATPARVMAEATGASFLEIHAHGLLGGDQADTSLLVLAPDAGGHYALGGDEIRSARLRGAPVVVLAACNASSIGATFHTTWGLADAFAEAGARAVIASPDPIQDAGAPAFFAAVRARIAAGQRAAVALRDERTARTDPAERAWIDRLVIFR